MPTAARPPRRLSLTGRGRLLAGVLAGLAVGGAVALLRPLPVVRALEGTFVDVRTRLMAGAREPDPRIVLAQVLADDVEAIERSQGVRWPWTLDYNEMIVRLLQAAGAQALLVDVMHLDRGAGPEDVTADGTFAPEVLQALQGDAELARAYGDALASLPHSVGALLLTDTPRYDQPARRAAVAGRVEAPGLPLPPRALTRRGMDLPVSGIGAGFKGLGFAHADTDPDGTLRRAVLVARAGDAPVLSVALALAVQLGGQPARLEDGVLHVAGRAHRVDDDGSFLVDFRRPEPGAYPRVAPAQLLAWADALGRTQQVPPEARAALEGKVVVWGVNLPGSDDLVPTAVSPHFDGPEWQAAVLDNLLHGGSRVHASTLANLLALLGAAALTGLLAMGLSGRLLPHVAAVGVLGAVVGAALLLFRAGTALDLFAPALAVLLTWLLATGLRLLTEGRYNRWLEGAFSHYLHPSVIAALKHDPSLLKLGGQSREVSVLFSDVAGFTGLSEVLTPPQVVHLLNVYLTAHCEAVFAEGGMVDKFIGDAVMAVYGDPVPAPDHALRACRSALAVQAGLPALEPVWRGMGLKAFPVRIGVNSGPAVVGNMGSTQRFNYTAMGDTVNVASRLEGANKAFHTSILLGAPTRDLAGDAILAKPLARLGVVGRGEPMQVYELAGLSADAAPDLRRHVEAYTRAHAAARAGDLPAARAALDEALRLRPGDDACAWLGGILQRLEQGLEPSPWSGVLTLSSK